MSVDKLPSGNDDLYLTLVGYDVAGSARDAADQLAEAAGGKSGKVAVIQEIPSQTLVSTLATAFREELAIRRRKSRWQP